MFYWLFSFFNYKKILDFSVKFVYYGHKVVESGVKV